MNPVQLVVAESPLPAILQAALQRLRSYSVRTRSEPAFRPTLWDLGDPTGQGNTDARLKTQAKRRNYTAFQTNARLTDSRRVSTRLSCNSRERRTQFPQNLRARAIQWTRQRTARRILMASAVQPLRNGSHINSALTAQTHPDATLR